MKRGNSPGSRKRAWLFVLILTGLAGAGTILVSIERKKAPSSDQPSRTSSTRAGNLPNSPAIALTRDSANSARSVSSAFEEHRLAVLNGRFGKMPLEELLRALTETQGGPDVQLIYQALALRKQEALPLVKAKLRS